MKTTQQFIGFILLLLLFSCGVDTREENKPVFVDIESLNKDIKSHVGIDINLQKQKADSVYSIDKQFYLKLVEEMSGGQNSNCFDRAKIDRKPIDLNGNEILNTDLYDSLGSIMMSCYDNNMSMDSCNENSKDSLCILKTRWHYHISGASYGQYGYSYFFPGLYELYKNELLTDDEFHYTILYLHYLGVFNATPRENEAYNIN